MAGIALKSCKAWVKCDNGFTATGRESVKTYTLKGGNSKGTADNYVGALSSVVSLLNTPALSYGRTEENLVSDEL